MVRQSFAELSKAAFITLYGVVVRPHFDFGMEAYLPTLEADIFQQETFQRLATWLATGLHQVPGLPLIKNI